MMKRLTRHGNSRAIVIDKEILETAANPSGGLVIQSIENNKKDVFQENFEKLNKKYKKLMQNLADL